MKKRKWLPSLSHLLLWSHVLGVIGFYIVLWRRTAPAKEDRAKQEPPKHENPVRSKSSPLVSVIVPARNEERNIRRCIHSLLEQDYESSFCLKLS